MVHLTRKLTIKCHPHWLARVDDMARRMGVTKSEVVRRAVDGAQLKERSDSGYQDLAYQLSKLGTNYNQTVALAHQMRYRSGEIPVAELLDQLRSHDAVLSTILQAVLAQDRRQRRR